MLLPCRLPPVQLLLGERDGLAHVFSGGLVDLGCMFEGGLGRTPLRWWSTDVLELERVPGDEADAPSALACVGVHDEGVPPAIVHSSGGALQQVTRSPA